MKNIVQFVNTDVTDENKHKMVYLDVKTGEIIEDEKATEEFIKTINEQNKIIREQEELRKDKNSPYRMWAQLNLEYAEELMYLSLHYPNSHSLLYFLVLNMVHTNACMVSYEVLMDVLGKSRPTIYRAVKELENLGFIYIFKSGTSNIYTINHNIFWKSYGKNIKYSAFPVDVVISSNEQIDRLKKILNKDTKDITLKAITKNDLNQEQK